MLSEIFMFESVNGRTEDVRTDASSNIVSEYESHPITSPRELAQVPLQKRETSDRLMPNIKNGNFSA